MSVDERILDISRRLAREYKEVKERIKDHRDALSVELDVERQRLAEELDQRQARLDIERGAIARERERLHVATPGFDDEVLQLNVGGQIFTTRRSTLCVYDGSYLANLFSGRWESSIERDAQGNFFLDFDPSLFRLVLNFLRSKRLQGPGALVPPPPAVPQDREEHFRNLVEYLGLTEQFQEAVEAAKAVAAEGLRASTENGAPTAPQPIGVALMQSAGALFGGLVRGGGQAAPPPGAVPRPSARAAAPPPRVAVPAVPMQSSSSSSSAPGSAVSLRDARRAAPATNGVVAASSSTRLREAFPDVCDEETAAEAKFTQARAQSSSPMDFAGGGGGSSSSTAAAAPDTSGASPVEVPVAQPPVVAKRPPGWSRKVAHRLAAVNEEDPSMVSIADTRSLGAAAAVRSTRGFRSGTHSWSVRIKECSDWSYVGFVSEAWSSVVKEIGRSAHSWGVASGGAAYAARAEVRRLGEFSDGSVVTFALDMEARTAAVYIDGQDFGVVFRDLPAPVFPAVSNCRSPACYVIMFQAGDAGGGGDVSVSAGLSSGAGVASSNSSVGPLQIQFKGSIAFSGKCKFQSQQNIVVQADNRILFVEKSTLQASLSISLIAPWINISHGSSLNAGLNVGLDASGHNKSSVLLNGGATATAQRGDVFVAADGISVVGGSALLAPSGAVLLKGAQKSGATGCSSGISIQAPKRSQPVLAARNHIYLSCGDGDVTVAGSANVTLLDAHNASGVIDVLAQKVRVDSNAALAAANIVIQAASDVNLSAAVMVGMQTAAGQPSQKTAIRVSTPQALVLGADAAQGRWVVASLFAAANSVLVQGQYVGTSGTDSCANSKSLNEDRCQQVLSAWSDDPDGAQKTLREAARGRADGLNVSFDMAVVAKSGLVVNPSAHLVAASMLMCAGAQMVLGPAAMLDATGRGCGPGRGPGAGESREPSFGCGAGGGSHLGQGGQGAKYDALTVTACAVSGPAYDGAQGYLPTAGASGGGCGTPVSACKDLGKQAPVPVSAGGGMIWLSAAAMAFAAGASVVADGTKGEIVAYPWSSPMDSSGLVSGGGSGGQILIFASELAGSKDNPASLSAQGGGAFCSKDALGGGGGGGFIGLRWYKGDWHVSVRDQINPPNVTGGSLDDTCVPSLPLGDRVWKQVQGYAGRAQSLAPCTPGHSGMFCSECPAGTYSDGYMESCADCQSKPQQAQWSAEAWPNKSCPFKCDAGVPNVVKNPNCLSALEYLFEFFGGTFGIVSIVTSMILAAAFIFCRRRAKGGVGPRGPNGLRRRHSVAASQVAGSERWVRALPVPETLRHVCCCLRPSSSRDAQASIESGEQTGTVNRGSTLKFTREQLPYHVLRLYLAGQNRPGRPWSLVKHIPAELEALLFLESWDALVAEVNAEATISSRDLWLNRVFRALYPPLADAGALLRRRRCAKTLRHVVRRFSEGSWGRRALWNPLKLRSPEEGEMVAAFGCDTAATLGYIDFFDFSRSQLDWAPVDLRHEVRLLVAHGHGSYAEPYALDIEDPLVQHLAQTDFGAHAVCSVISTFNRIARLVPASELQGSGTCPMVERLRWKVEQCAAQCGLSGFVQVLTVQLHGADISSKSRRSDPSGSMSVATTEHSFSDLMPPVATTLPDHSGPLLDGGEDGNATATSRSPAWSNSHLPSGRRPSDTSLRNSGLFLPERSIDGTGSSRAVRRPGVGSTGLLLSPPAASSPNLAHPAGGAASRGVALLRRPLQHASVDSTAQASRPSPTVRRPTEVKLCLAFTDRSRVQANTASPYAGQAGASNTLQPPTLDGALTSPMTQQGLREHLSPPHRREERAGGSATVESAAFALSPCSWEWCRSFVWRDHAAGTPNLVMLFVVVLMVIDLMGFVLASSMLLDLNDNRVFAVWILVPPFAEIAALILGPAFVFWEAPWMGRLVAAFQLSSTVSPTLSALLLTLVLQADSWYFDLLEMLTIIIVKVALFVVVHLHVGNLEAALDLRFADASQGDFLERLLSNGTNEERDRLESEGVVGGPPLTTIASAGSINMSLALPVQQRSQQRSGSISRSEPSPF